MLFLYERYRYLWPILFHLWPASVILNGHKYR